MNCPHVPAGYIACLACINAAGAEQGPALPLVRRGIPCCICKRPVLFETTTNLDPECPEMFAVVGGQGADRSFFGIVREDDGTPIVVVTCSGACLRRMIDGGAS